MKLSCPFRLPSVILALIALGGCAVEGLAPTLPDLPAGVWTELAPAGETRCADGSAYSFFVRPGSTNRVLVDFMGGGACWDAFTCARPLSEVGAAGYYLERVRTTPEGLASEAGAVGIYDHGDPRNPFADWYHVLIPYCSGDLHLGNSTVDYGDGLRLDHRGAVNARAAIDWLRDSFGSPEQVFVTGCSAGAYASIFWTPLLRTLFPSARLGQLGDSGAGVVTEEFLSSGFRGWNVDAAVPDALIGIAPGDLYQREVLSNFYRAVGSAFPEVAVAQYNTLFDGVQTYFYAAMLDVEPTLELALEWSEEMLASLEGLEAEAGSFASYVANYDFRPDMGTPHCIITSDDLYTLSTNGVSFLDWLETLVHAGGVESVRPAP